MKQKTKIIILLFLGVMIVYLSHAQTTIKVNGISYSLYGSNASVIGADNSEKIVIPSTIIYNDLEYTVNKIKSDAFVNTDVAEIILPNTIESISNRAFNNNRIKKVKLNEGLTWIMGRAFQESSITEIIIPKSLEKFGDDVFYGCSLLRTMIYLGEKAPENWYANSFPSYLFVPDTTVYNQKNKYVQVIPLISFKDTLFTYNGFAPTTTWTSNMEGYDVQFAMPSLNSDAGRYQIIIPATFTKGEVSFTANIPYRYTITPVKLKTKVYNTSRTYGENNPEFNITYSGFINGDNESVLTTKPVAATIANEKSAVGSYPITISGGKAKNYTFEYEQGELIVNKASLGIQVMDASKVYGTDNPTFTLGYSGLKNNETLPEWTTKPTFTTTATKASSAGVYEVCVTCDPRNYTITTNTPGKLTITKAPLTIKANNATMDYCGTMPTYNYTYSGFVNGDDETTLSKKPSIATDATTTSNAGEYVITPEGAEAANYDFTYTAGTLTINKRPLTVKANSVSRLYGEDNPTFTVEYSGFVNSETKAVLDVEPTASTTATIKSQAGSYDIMVSDGKAKNYTFNYQSGQLTITPRTLKAFVDDYERAYGEENPPFTIEYDGFVLNDNKNSLMTQPTAYTSAKKTSNVGTYAIEVLGGYSPNYTFTYGSGTLTIVKAEQTFTWDQDLSNLKVGDQVELQAYASSNLPITFTMDSEDFAEIYKAGSKTYMECKKAGSFHIKAVQEGNDNYYSTQRINKSVTIVEEGASAVEATSGSKVSIQATVGGIVITGVSSDDVIHVYNIDGILQKAVRAEGSQVEIPLYKDNVYVIKIGPKTVKLRL